jgi:hypothetical protein
VENAHILHHSAYSHLCQKSGNSAKHVRPPMAKNKNLGVLKNKKSFIWSCQETFKVQDPPASPSDTLLLPPLKRLYKANERIQERPQQGDSRPVMSPSQCTLSRHIMRKWEPWITNTGKSNNHRILQQLSFHEIAVIDPVKSLPGLSLGNLCLDKPHQASFER